MTCVTYVSSDHPSEVNESYNLTPTSANTAPIKTLQHQRSLWATRTPAPRRLSRPGSHVRHGKEHEKFDQYRHVQRASPRRTLLFTPTPTTSHISEYRPSWRLHLSAGKLGRSRVALSTRRLSREFWGEYRCADKDVVMEEVHRMRKRASKGQIQQWLLEKANETR